MTSDPRFRAVCAGFAAGAFAFAAGVIFARLGGDDAATGAVCALALAPAAVLAAALALSGRPPR